FNSNSVNRIIGVNVSNSHNANDASSDNYINRYWTFSDNQNGAAYNYNATFTPVAADIQTNSSKYGNISMAWWNGSNAWTSATTLYPGSPSYYLFNMNQTTAPLQY